jgi:amino acid transporter
MLCETARWVTTLYVIIMIVSTHVIPCQELGGSLVPVVDVAVVFAGSVGVVAVVVAAISSSNSSVLAAPRVLFAMGRDNLMSDWLNETHDPPVKPNYTVSYTHVKIFATRGVDTARAFIADSIKSGGIYP